MDKNLLNGMAFIFLLVLMLSYWSQAAFFGREKYKTFNNFIFLLSISSLTTLLIIRWIESGHFPLSNLYESLLFLSWCFLSLKVGFEIKPLATKKWLPTATFTRIQSWFYNLSLKNNRASKSLFFSNPLVLQSEALNMLEKPPKSPVVNKSLPSLEKEFQFSNLGLGVVLAPLSLLNFGFAFLSLPKEMQQATALVPALQSNWLMMHVTVMVLSYAALLSGSLLSIAFLILNRLQTTKNLPRDPADDSTEAFSPFYKRAHSKNGFLKPLDSVNNFDANSGRAEEVISNCTSNDLESVENLLFSKGNQPRFFLKDGFVSKLNKRENNLQNKVGISFAESNLFSQCENKEIDFSLTARLDNYSYRILALGFPLLTIGILSGAVWANEAWGSYWSWDPKETWALITWLVFAIYLHTRITKGWSGEKSAIVASVGFFIVWFCYLGVNLLGTGLHSYGWFSK